VSGSVVARLLALACVALLAGLLALAWIEHEDDTAAAVVPEGAPAPGGWYEALAASRGPVGDAERTTCGLVLTAKSLGVTHPVLPCGARILVRYGDLTALTEVIDNELQSSGRQFELTEALALKLKLDGIQQVDWRFAERPANR
jgi:hypothetical protein